MKVEKDFKRQQTIGFSINIRKAVITKKKHINNRCTLKRDPITKFTIF